MILEGQNERSLTDVGPVLRSRDGALLVTTKERLRLYSSKGVAAASSSSLATLLGSALPTNVKCVTVNVTADHTVYVNPCGEASASCGGMRQGQSIQLWGDKTDLGYARIMASDGSKVSLFVWCEDEDAWTRTTTSTSTSTTT